MCPTKVTAVDFLNQKLSEIPVNRSELARRAHIHKELLRRSLAGTRKLSADEFISLCRALNLTDDDFIGVINGE